MRVEPRVRFSQLAELNQKICAIEKILSKVVEHQTAFLNLLGTLNTVVHGRVGLIIEQFSKVLESIEKIQKLLE